MLILNVKFRLQKVNVMPSCYLQWPSVKHCDFSYIIWSDNTFWNIVFPARTSLWLLLPAELPC